MSIPINLSTSQPVVPLPQEISEVVSPSLINFFYKIKITTDALVINTKQVFQKLETNLSNISIEDLKLRINKLGTKTEHIFNTLGCVPFIGATSGSLRNSIGYLQILTGAALITLSEIGIFMNKIQNNDQELNLKWKKISILGAEQILHGCLNAIRGYAEMLIGTYSFGLGNVIFLLPNIYKDEPFSPYLAYGILKA